jgi:ParB-like chromosome segregation protein Spo0J
MTYKLSNVETIKVSEIRNPINKSVDEDKMANIVDSIRNGYRLAPLVLVHIKNAMNEDYYQSLYGIEILEACRLLKIKKIPAVIIKNEQPAFKRQKYIDAQMELETVPFHTDDDMLVHLVQAERNGLTVPPEAYMLLRYEGIF